MFLTCSNFKLKIDLSDSDLTGRIWARMMLKQLCMNLEHLFLSMTDISIVDVMVSGASLPNLTQLVLDGCAFGYAFSKNIASHDLSGGAQVVPSQYNNSQPSAMGVVPFPKLQVLGLSSVNDMSIYALVWLLVRCPSLSMLRTLNARLKLTLVLLAVGQYCPQIKYLEYSAMSHYTPMPIDDAQLTLLPHALQSLRCRAKQDDAVLHSLLARCAPSLQYLSTVVADTTLYFMSARPWPQLNVLEIPLSVDVSEMALTAAIKAFTHLTHIDVSYNQTAVTDAFLVALGASCPSIQVLRVAGCTQLSDAAMAECTLQLDQLHTLGLFGLDLTRKTITHIVLDGGLRAGGIIECPHDIIVQRTPASYPPSMPPHLTHHFETLIDAIFYAMRADPYASNATDDDNLMSSAAKPPTPLPTSLAPSSPPDMDNDEIPLTNALRDILRKDDLWSVYI
ncbi:hypothetical protein BC940DRAFT_123508 [Gongronella butleri]|nr:hypothetical protein BC940DRAFT_123508 [Gongronella butleri]